ncbi:MAG: RNA ligase family protein [Clostridium sp.]|nr:RNA ligase family protein [Clostridium sp.]
MAEYQKIQTLFKRDERNIIIPDQFTYPEFEVLKDLKWECTEKIDGTNIRIELASSGNSEDGIIMSFKGRTDKANIPEHLLTKLNWLFDREHLMEALNITDETQDCNITLYGEGYGAKIQKGGNYISNDVNFILFDVKVGKWWLDREAIKDIANKLGINAVPLMGYMTIPEAIEYVKRGFKSTIAENKDYDAEGLVLKAPCGLLKRDGERLITKIKTVDFRKYQLAYPNKL